MPPHPTCRELIERLIDYLDGTASHEDFHAHLARCSSCRAYVDSYLKTIRLVRGAMSE
jgi:anti-sigma factor RsiW